METKSKLERAKEVLLNANLGLSEEEYHMLKTLSYSDISNWYNSQYQFIQGISRKRNREITSSLRYGSIIDDIVTNNGNKYYCTNCEIPTQKEMEVIKFAINNNTSFSNAANAIGYNNRLKAETINKKFEEMPFVNYCKSTNYENINKEPISIDENKLRSDVMNLLYNSHSCGFVTNNKKNINQIQLKRYFYINGYSVELKGMLDGIYFDPIDNKIELWDLKTTSKPIEKWATQCFIPYHYSIQSSLYWHLVYDTLKEANEGLELLLEPEYKFIVISDNACQCLLFVDKYCTDEYCQQLEDEFGEGRVNSYGEPILSNIKRFKDNLLIIENDALENNLYSNNINRDEPNVLPRF